MADVSDRNIKRRRNLRVLRLALLIILAIILVLVVYIVLNRRTYRNYSVVTSGGQEDVTSTSYIEMNGSVLKYNTDEASLLSRDLSALWSDTYSMENPVADVKGNYAIIADVDGTAIQIYNSNGVVGSITTSYTIVKACVSLKGTVAAILDGGEETWINYYAADGSVIAENQTNIEDPGYPMDVAVSDSGEVMMVTYQFIDGGKTTSYVAFYNFGDVGQTEDDRIVSGYTYEDVIVPEIEYLSEDRSVAVRDDGFTIYEGNQIPTELVTVEAENEIVSIFYDDETIGLVFQNEDSDKMYRLMAYSTDGTLKFERDFNTPYTSIKMSDGFIVMYNSTQLCILNEDGRIKYNGTIDGTLQNFYKLKGNRYLLILENGTNVIRFS